MPCGRSEGRQIVLARGKDIVRGQGARQALRKDQIMRGMRLLHIYAGITFPTAQGGSDL